MTTIHARFRTARKAPAPKRGNSAAPKPVSRAARMLALAHHVERLADDGALPDYAAAARPLGLTRARLTQVMNLLLLAPRIQEKVLAGDLRASERGLRSVVGESEWERQAAAVESCGEARGSPG